MLEERGLSPEYLSAMPESDRVEWLRMPAKYERVLPPTGPQYEHLSPPAHYERLFSGPSQVKLVRRSGTPLYRSRGEEPGRNVNSEPIPPPRNGEVVRPHPSALADAKRRVAEQVVREAVAQGPADLRGFDPYVVASYGKAGLFALPGDLDAVWPSWSSMSATAARMEADGLVPGRGSERSRPGGPQASALTPHEDPSPDFDDVRPRRLSRWIYFSAGPFDPSTWTQGARPPDQSGGCDIAHSAGCTIYRVRWPVPTGVIGTSSILNFVQQVVVEPGSVQAEVDPATGLMVYLQIEIDGAVRNQTIKLALPPLAGGGTTPELRIEPSISGTNPVFAGPVLEGWVPGSVVVDLYYNESDRRTSATRPWDQLMLQRLWVDGAAGVAYAVGPAENVSGVLEGSGWCSFSDAAVNPANRSIIAVHTGWFADGKYGPLGSTGRHTCPWLQSMESDYGFTYPVGGDDWAQQAVGAVVNLPDAVALGWTSGASGNQARLGVRASLATGTWDGPLRGHAHLNFSPDGRRLVAYEQAGVDIEADIEDGREQSMSSWSYVAERGAGWTSGPRRMRQAFEVPERESPTGAFESVFPTKTVNTSGRQCPRYFFKRARFCWSNDVFVVTAACTHMAAAGADAAGSWEATEVVNFSRVMLVDATDPAAVTYEDLTAYVEDYVHALQLRPKDSYPQLGGHMATCG